MTGARTMEPAAAAGRRAIPRAKIGIVHILWANDDLPDLTPPIEPLHILDEIARLGFEGTQLAGSFPRGAALDEALAARALRIAEVYACIECDADGPVPGALEVGRAKLAELHAAHGDTLVAALPVGPAPPPWGGGGRPPRPPPPGPPGGGPPGGGGPSRGAAAPPPTWVIRSPSTTTSGRTSRHPRRWTGSSR